MSLLFGPRKQDGQWPKFSDVREKELGEVFFSDDLIEELRHLRAEYLQQVEQGPVTQLLSDSKAVAQVDKDLTLPLFNASHSRVRHAARFS